MGSLVPNIYLEAYAEVPVKWCPVNKKNEKKMYYPSKISKTQNPDFCQHPESSDGHHQKQSITILGQTLI